MSHLPMESQPTFGQPTPIPLKKFVTFQAPSFWINFLPPPKNWSFVQSSEKCQDWSLSSTFLKIVNRNIFKSSDHCLSTNNWQTGLDKMRARCRSGVVRRTKSLWGTRFFRCARFASEKVKNFTSTSFQENS